MQAGAVRSDSEDPRPWVDRQELFAAEDDLATERRQPRNEMGGPPTSSVVSPLPSTLTTLMSPGPFPVLRERNAICLLSGDQSTQSSPWRNGVY